MSNEKLCVDCRWCVGIDRFAKCHAPGNVKTTSVNGEDILRIDFCSIHRPDGFFLSLLGRTCGKRGRWFEAKENEG